MTKQKSESSYFENQANPGNLASKISQAARKDMFRTLMEITGANSQTKVLDVGVTIDDKWAESNFFEKMYPYPENITAVGVEDASFLEKKHRGLKFIQADGLHLPFADKSFDLVTSFAVIEHVGNRDNQNKYVEELYRVGKSCVITTPNRWFPVEIHTMMPLIHWLPPEIFRSLIRRIGKTFYAQENNLNLLDAKILRQMFPKNMNISTHHYRLFGMISNLFFYAQNLQK